MTSSDSILVADIGGTNARLAIAERPGDGSRRAHLSGHQTHPITDYPDFEGALEAYRSAHKLPALQAACFAVAGPVSHGRASLTNGAWHFDEAVLSKALGVPVRLANDFEVLAWAAPVLAREDMEKIKAGTAEPGAPVVVMGPGTGFGTALWVPHGEGGIALPAEAGHSAFPAVTAQERLVADYIAKTRAYVSAEAVLSGSGLTAIDAALRSNTGNSVSDRSSGKILKRAAADPAARAAIDLFLGSFGCVAGNIALSCGARGGVLLAGGMAQALADHYAASAFNTRFAERGPMTPYTQAIPVSLITNPHAALLGAAARAFHWQS